MERRLPLTRSRTRDVSVSVLIAADQARMRAALRTMLASDGGLNVLGEAG